jgi:hypothetical protein
MDMDFDKSQTNTKGGSYEELVERLRTNAEKNLGVQFMGGGALMQPNVGTASAASSPNAVVNYQHIKSPSTVTLTLSIDDAAKLRALLGSLFGGAEGSPIGVQPVFPVRPGISNYGADRFDAATVRHMATRIYNALRHQAGI